MDIQILSEYLMAAALHHTNAEQLRDRVIAQIPAEVIADAVSELILSGPNEAWTGCLDLIGLLGGRFESLWQNLINAVITRTDLGTFDRLSALALLNSEGRLSDSDQLAEMRNELTELEELQTWSENSLRNQLLDGPDHALPILERLGALSDQDRIEVVQDLLNSVSPQFRERISSWFAESHGVPNSFTKLMDQAERNSEEESQTRFEGWVTDFTLTGQFGCGLEFSESDEFLHRFILGGSWNHGIRIFEYREAAGNTDPFKPQLPSGRSLCQHPTLVKKWAIPLLNRSYHHDFEQNPSIWTAGYLREELLQWTAEDQEQWEIWTTELVDQNPVSPSMESLELDSEQIGKNIRHWFAQDLVAAELRTEFSGSLMAQSSDRKQSIVRVWFERHLGPRIQELIGRLQAMSYFWLAVSETSDITNPEQWKLMGKAAARLARDLADPARVVASHPFVHQVAKLAFDQLNQRD
ncbi:MAG: hypothetical protein RJA81_56 [Planctomycetota bacterium]